MRTTVSIDDKLYEAARLRAFESRRTLGEVINDLLATGLRASEASTAPRVLGQFRGQVRVPEDFDDTPMDVAAALEQPV
jgi:hypothetical protein